MPELDVTIDDTDIRILWAAWELREAGNSHPTVAELAAKSNIDEWLVNGRLHGTTMAALFGIRI